MKYVVYILLCDQKTFYVGITGDLKKRLTEHKTKTSFFTKKFSDINLVYIEEYPELKSAERREKQLKGWSRAKKIALIKSDIDKLKQLSRAVSVARPSTG